MEINDTTAGVVWLRAIQSVLLSGVLVRDEADKLLELLNLTCVIQRPSDTDSLIDSLVDKDILQRMFAKFSRISSLPDAHFSYAQRLYAMGGINQINWAINRIKQKPETKSATIGLLAPGEENPHLPCLSLLDFKLRDGQLRCTAFFRSQNIGTRHPCNSLALARMLMTMGDRMNTPIGPLTIHIASAHIYYSDISFCRASLKQRHLL